ncbi:MAG: hypothetical protein ACI8XM_001832 [Haloarculaceae archaeon]|jgi:hypothetical protein
MEEDVDVPPSKTVVIVNGGDGNKYHRQTVLPWRAFACPIETASETERVPRLEAEVRGYDPCLRSDCFGNSQS